VVDKFLHVTDMHFWRVVRNPLALLNKRFLGNVNVMIRRRHEFHMANAEPFSDALQACGVETVVLGGDFTSTAYEEEFVLAVRFVRGLEARGLRVILMPGNHDVYTFESVRRRRFERHFAAWLPEGGWPSLHHLPGGTPLIVAPTVCPNVVSSKGRVREEDAAAVAGLLANCGAERVVVAGHYPVLHAAGSYASSPGRRLRNASALHLALGASKKEVLYIAGHVHRFSYTRDAHFPGLRHVTTGAFFFQRPGEAQDGAFSEVHVTHDDFRVFAHAHAGVWGSQEAEAETLGA